MHIMLVHIMHVMKFHAFHAFYILSIIQNMGFWAFFRQKMDKIGQFKTIGGEKGRKSVNYLKIKEEVICRNSPNKKKEKKCQFLKSLGRGYLSEQSYQKRKEKGDKVSILEKFRKSLFVGTDPPKKKEKKT